MNISLLLDMAADVMGDRTAIGAREAGTSYAALRERAQAIASAVRDHGGGRLVLAGENTDDLPALVFGAALAGVPFTSVNYRLPDDRLREALARSAPAVLVADARTAPRVADVPGTHLTTVEALVAEGDPTAPTTPAAQDAVAVALFTSGTTGTPKSVLLRHRNLTSYVISTTEFMAAGDDEAALVSVPPYHVAGMASVLSNIYLGRRVIYLPTFEAAAWVRAADREHVTHAMIVPTMLARILDEMETTGARLPHLRHLSSGGGRMPLSVIERALRLLPHVDFVNAYGLTETSSTITVLGPDDHRSAVNSPDPDVAARLGSVGRVVPGVELEIHGVDGRPLPAGRLGEVVVRGDQVAGEYDGDDAKDPDGWFHTRDTGWLDPEGYLFLAGRADDVIVRGGENMSPGEIEDVLTHHPDVVDAAVVGVPDEEWGEAVAAFVVLRDGSTLTADEVREHVAQHLRSSRRPRVVEFRLELPYSETGKLLRRELRAATANTAPTD